MSSRVPATSAREHPENTAILLREAFAALNDRAVARLAEYGHDAVRPAHSAVFQFLDDEGTTVTVLAERAQMTKQSMAELVRHLEENEYVERITDPSDGRAKLVIATDWGRQVFAIVRDFTAETEEQLAALLGKTRLERLREDLAKIIASGAS
jgi:DNA-binding MarR family transcriptional regulator